ncbi:hypothetical protein CEXT_442241 [Caerostris extrusa]|uniref:Uncharacterized protein n=1 Tax=Caerostris extrusa TaxID=172846 RepID=A0AAV4S0R2_CAEEX|nr:hypothetical protein CEXT_442241 [Caerostris extrusa]
MEAMKERPKTKKKKTESKKNVNAESFSVKKLSQEEKLGLSTENSHQQVTDIGNKNNSEEIAVNNFSEILCEESEMKKECTTNEKFASNKVTDSSQILKASSVLKKNLLIKVIYKTFK